MQLNWTVSLFQSCLIGQRHLPQQSPYAVNEFRAQAYFSFVVAMDKSTIFKSHDVTGSVELRVQS